MKAPTFYVAKRQSECIGCFREIKKGDACFKHARRRVCWRCGNMLKKQINTKGQSK